MERGDKKLFLSLYTWAKHQTSSRNPKKEESAFLQVSTGYIGNGFWTRQNFGFIQQGPSYVLTILRCQRKTYVVILLPTRLDIFFKCFHEK